MSGVSAGCSCCGRRGAVCGGLPSAQHVGGSRAGATSCGLLRPWTDCHVESGHSHHINVHS
eukprot:4335807-Prymnesium_polylepis.1